MYDSLSKTCTLVSGQVYELLTNRGDAFPVLIVSAFSDNSAATLRLFDMPRRINNVSVFVNGVEMYTDVGKPGYTLATDLNGKIGELSNDDLSKVRRNLASALNLYNSDNSGTLDTYAECKKLETALESANKDIQRLNAALANANAELDQLDDAKREIDKLTTTLGVYKTLYSDLLSKIAER